MGSDTKMKEWVYNFPVLEYRPKSWVVHAK